MLRARHARWLAVLGLAGASLGASCTDEQAASDPAPAAAPARPQRDDRPRRVDRRVLRVDEPEETGTPPTSEWHGDVATREPAAIARQRDIVEVLRFDTELLREDIKQRKLAEAERLYGPGGIRDQIPEKLGRLRAKALRRAPRITDADLAKELKDDVLDPIEEFANALWLQRDAVSRLRNDAERLKSYTRAAEELSAESSSDTSPESVIASGLAGARDQVTWLSSSVTDPDLARELRDHVLDVLDECARSPCLATLREKQRCDVEKLKFDVELLREDIRQKSAYRAEHRFTDHGGLRTLAPERLLLLRRNADRLADEVVDAGLARDLKIGVLDVLDEIEKSPFAE